MTQEEIVEVLGQHAHERGEQVGRLLAEMRAVAQELNSRRHAAQGQDPLARRLLTVVDAHSGGIVK